MNLKSTHRFLVEILTGLVLVSMLGGCTLSLARFPATPTPEIPPTATGPTPTPQPAAMLTFRVTLPAALAPGESLSLSVLDEVTGLSMNATNYPMQGVNAQTYTLSLPFILNSVVKYRYVRQAGLPVGEDTGTDTPVRYRLYHLTGQGEVQDVVASWSDTPFSGSTGRITGQVLSSADNSPVPDVLVAAGGFQTLTDSLGAFSLDGLPPGTHNLVAYALDGSFVTFQQGALVQAGQHTPVEVRMAPAVLVNVTFSVAVPANTIPAVPLRMAGNLYQLGNTFGDLNGGLSTVATRMPVLASMVDGRYTLTLSLPVGADLRYKYTLGDGFWNAEHYYSGEFVLRQLIVPAADAYIEDSVETWQSGDSAPITFDVAVPQDTPATDTVSIQFNPYGWTEPIPMWALGNNRWVYKLFSPLNMLGQFEYRYCRNDQCDAADDSQTPTGHRGRPVSTSLIDQDLRDVISSWVWAPIPGQASVIASQVQPRNTAFFAGVEYQTNYDPTWQAWMNSSLQGVKGLGANWVVLTPTWTVRNTSPLAFAPLPGADPLWDDTSATISQARAQGLSVALFPSPQFPLASPDWWISAPRSASWWDTWFGRYQAFAIYHADLAARNGAQALVLGGDWLAPALPNGVLADGNLSGVPSDAEGRWRMVLAAVRNHYGGPVYWAIAYPGGLENAPGFISGFDGVYVLWNAPLTNAASASVVDMTNEAGNLMDTDLQAFVNPLNKPLILAVAYPSVQGTAWGCLDGGNGSCLPWTTFNQPAVDNPKFNVDLQTQSDIYQAMLTAANARSWITGFVTRGYYPPTAIRDESASVNGKPAADVLWYWFPRLLGLQQ